MQPQKSLEKFHSLPNLARGSSNVETEFRRLYSLSLSQIQRHSEFSDYNYKPAPFNIRWIYGYNPKVGVINLNAEGTTTAFYAASNCGVLYNWTANHMRILQGHRHMVTCIAKDKEGRWLVTADSGPENILIIWDSSDYFPVRTIYTPHGSVRLSKVALSADAKYLLTLGYQDKANLRWWIWALGKDEPHATIDVEIPQGGVIDMAFNPYNSKQFLLMTKNDIWIGVSGKIFVFERGLIKETDDYELKIRMPPKKISPDYGKLTCFTFVEDTSQILVATNRGAVLVYSYTIEYQTDVDASNYENLRFVKVLKVEQKKIQVIKSVDGVIVTGNSVGDIRFYDPQMKLLYWVHGFQVDSIKDLSFNILPRSYKIFDPKCKKMCVCWEKVVSDIDPETGAIRQKLLKMKIPSDATVGGKPFIVRDFIVCTGHQGVGFADFVTEKLTTILDNKISYALSITVHPDKPYVCIGFADGIIEMHNFIQHKLFKRINLREHFKIVIPPKDDSIKCNTEITKPRLAVTCLRYSPSGLHLACGLNTGELLFLDPITLDILTKKPHKDIQYSIKEINYSCDSLTLVLADIGRTVAVYKYDCVNFEWQFIGKHRAHYKNVTAAFFLPKKNDDGEYKLVSIGADRIMVEYDIGKSSEEYLEIFSLDRIEQAAVPLTGIPWPTPKDLDPEEHRTNLPLILIADNEHKYKIVNYSTTMSLSTVLGPRYEHPVNKVQLITVNKEDKQLQYLLFSTKNVIGIQKMPLDGNPWKHVGMLGHPIEVINMCFREDNGVLFTIGSKDNCMTQWAANYRAVETTTKLGGGDLDPYYCLIEDGRPGWLFHEIRDLFYYIQILCQGTFSPAMRRVKDYIPIDSLPDLMRALGYFPTEYEVENLIIEAKFKVYQRKPSTEIDFEEFVKLYLNHRPAFGDSFKNLKNSFAVFATAHRDSYVIYRDDFIDMLTSNGECFSQELAWYLLSILYGHSFEERAAMTDNDFSFLPEEITFSELVSNIIGIQDVENLSEYSAMSAVFQSVASDSDELNE
ncbi:cilia- and flagella-associated protein 251-like [Epargyreus clarus]|uniref:cilia- and flagella-associated protein 251-like n=1 Tax=Epargyreus clarus TaxID=520877 RepID=UPI003C2F7085